MERKVPEISIILPMYNKRDLVGRAIDSVLAQGFTDWELIIIDDGSTDCGTETVKKYTDRRIKYLWQENAGAGPARNNGIKNSTGRYLTFLDADDEWLPEFLEISYATLEENLDCDFSVAGYYLDYAVVDGKLQRDVDATVRLMASGWTQGPHRLSPEASDFELHHVLGHINTDTLFARREVIEKYGGYYDTKRAFGEDTYLYWLLVQNHRFYRICRPLSWYHLDESEIWGHDNMKRAIHPILLNPEFARDSCEPGYEAVIERLLAMQALFWAFVFVRTGQVDQSRWLIKQYPGMKIWKLQYLKLRIKVLLPFFFIHAK